MDILGMETIPNTEGMEMAVVNALDQKRREIAREIAEFRAMKEKEFIAFERQLRAADKKAVAREYSQQNAKTEEGKKSLENIGELGRGQGSIVVFGARLESFGRRSLADISNRVRQPTDLSYGNAISGTEPAKWPTSFEATELHDREVEFQGLFTPSYLPLLDGSIRKQKDWPGKPALKISIQSDERRASLRNSATMSSPASFPPSIMTSSSSPPTTRSFSASAPREQASHHGRPSSGSDTSVACLRSSLRDPAHPRSPKRVLFSIDNLVVSPSTSPTAQQRSTASKFRGPEIDNVPRGFEKTVAGKNKEAHLGGSWDNSSATAFAKNQSTMSTANRKPIVYAAGSYQGSSGIAKSRLRDGGDEFVSVGLEDDLFTFDEDLDLVESKNVGKTEGSAGSEEDDEGTKGEPRASSPHAGSLPIEIKWPTRRDRRN